VTNCIIGNWMIVWNEELWVVTPQSHMWIPALWRNYFLSFSRSEDSVMPNVYIELGQYYQHSDLGFQFWQ
jgi:hypothetical protein